MNYIDFASVKEQEQGKGFVVLPVGAYECVIMDVVDDASKQSLTVYLEIASGEFKGYYTKNTREGNPVRYGMMFVGYANDQFNSVGKFKSFVTALCHDNPNFHWDGRNEKAFIGKHCAVVFGEREYFDNDGNLHTATNPRYPISLSRMRESDYTIPKKKLATKRNTAGFTPVEDAKLPWDD